MDLKDYITLWRLSSDRIRSEEAYRTFQAFQAALLIKYFRRFDVEISNKRVLDLGSGIGGYSKEMLRQGATVISLDLTMPTQRLEQRHHATIANALFIPLSDNHVDFILCASLIEHVSDPGLLLSEIHRTLAKEGYCYLSFPPFYSPLGGHEFSPFHYLGEDWAIRLRTQRRKIPRWVSELYHVSSAPQSFSDIYQDWGLFKMTIRKAKHLIKSSGLRIVDMSTRFFPLSLIRWPVIGEILTWHAQFLLQKSG